MCVSYVTFAAFLFLKFVLMNSGSEKHFSHDVFNKLSDLMLERNHFFLHVRLVQASKNILLIAIILL